MTQIDDLRDQYRKQLSRVRSHKGLVGKIEQAKNKLDKASDDLADAKGRIEKFEAELQSLRGLQGDRDAGIRRARQLVKAHPFLLDEFPAPDAA